MRLFFGIQLADNIREYLSDLILEFQSYIPSGIKWVETENLHITFQFIGEVKPTQLEVVEENFLTSISACERQKFKITGLELFPLSKPRLIWISLSSENRQFAKATKSLRNFLKQAGFNIEDKEMVPHITLGRIKANLIKPQIDFILEKEIEKHDIDINAISLFESNLTKKGAIYRILQTYNLK